MDLITREIEHYFSFLFDSGFHIQSSKYIDEYMGYWEIIFEHSDCLVEIRDDRGEVCLDLGNKHEKTKKEMWFDLSALVFYLSEGQNFIGQFDGQLRERDQQFLRLAGILADYLDKIIPVIGPGYELNKPSLLESNRLVYDLYMEEYRTRRK